MTGLEQPLGEQRDAEPRDEHRRVDDAVRGAHGRLARQRLDALDALFGCEHLQVDAALGDFETGATNPRAWLAFLRVTGLQRLETDEWRTSDQRRARQRELARTIEQVLKQCGDNLTRENVMKQAAAVKGLKLDTLIPDSANQPYDMHEVISRVLDDGDFLEVQPLFAPNILVGFGRVDGHSVGVVANQPT